MNGVVNKQQLFSLIHGWYATYWPGIYSLSVPVPVGLFLFPCFRCYEQAIYFCPDKLTLALKVLNTVLAVASVCCNFIKQSKCENGIIPEKS